MALLGVRIPFFYFKDQKGNEVDFLLTRKNKPAELIQVTHSLEDMQTKKREVKSLVSAAGQHKIKQCMILTNDQRDEMAVDKLKIKVMPLWQWLLEQ